MAKARLLAPLAALLMFGSAAGLGQQPSSQSNTRYTLRGSVVNSLTGEPIRKALVQLNGPESKSAFTGSDGQFQFDSVTAGSYSASAGKVGYANAVPGTHSVQTFNAGPETGPLALTIAPLAKISGRVLDTEGEPVTNLNVQSLLQTIQMGHKHFERREKAMTDDGGNFLIDNLQPGKYLVVTGQQQVYPGLIADDIASRLIYRRQYYPNSPDISAAQLLAVSPGEDTRADITISTVKGTRVFFSAVPAQPWVRTTLRDNSGDEIDAQVRRNIKTGGWILPSIPPGSWQLRLETNSNGEQLSGEVTIEAGQTDLRNVVVPLSPYVQVPIEFTGSKNTSSSPANVQLVSTSETQRVNGFVTPSQPGGGQMVISALPPGTYHLAADAAGTECVDSVTAGSSDLSRVGYVVPSSGTPQTINVALRSDCASLEISSTQGPDQPFQAVIIGGPHTLEPLVQYGMGKTVAKLAPGDYDIFAFSDVNEIDYANPDVLKSFSGQHVSLGPNQSGTIRVEVISPGESR